MSWINWILFFSLLVPYVPQTGQGADKYKWDCGAASASMMIEHYTGLHLDPDELMSQFGPDGYLTAGEVRWLLERYGLETKWGRESPRIILIGGNHWVVYLGDCTYHDPLVGPCQIGCYNTAGIYIDNVKNELIGHLEE